MNEIRIPKGRIYMAVMFLVYRVVDKYPHTEARWVSKHEQPGLCVELVVTSIYNSYSTF